MVKGDLSSNHSGENNLTVVVYYQFAIRHHSDMRTLVILDTATVNVWVHLIVHLIVPGWRTAQVSEVAITRGVNTAQHVLSALQVLVSKNGWKSHLTAISNLPWTLQTSQQYPSCMHGHISLVCALGSAVPSHAPTITQPDHLVIFSQGRAFYLNLSGDI